MYTKNSELMQHCCEEMKVSNNKLLITLSSVKNLIKQLTDPEAEAEAEERLKASKQYCFSIPKGQQIFFRDLKLAGFAIRATRHSLVYTVEKKMPNGVPCRVTIGDHGCLHTRDCTTESNRVSFRDVSRNQP